jgi:glutathione S-transferase
MLKLYGFSVSNYYNMVKLALLEKGLPFEEVPFYGANPRALAVSPRGKVPVLGVEQGFINETSVILEYIEQTQQGRRCCRRSIRARAGVGACQGNRVVHRTAGACYAEAFFGMTVPDAIKEKPKPSCCWACGPGPTRQVRAVRGGRQLEHGGSVFLYSVPWPVRWAETVRDRPAGGVPQAKALLERLSRIRMCRRSRRTKTRRCRRFWR